MAGPVRRGEIRWYPFPQPDKRRPVLVLSRDESIPYLAKLTVAEVTRTVRGAPTEIRLGADEGMREVCAINLRSLHTIPKRQLGALLARLPEDRWPEVQRALMFALGF